MRGAETILWVGGEHRFRLGIGELRAIEQAGDAGVSVVLMRLLAQQWKVDDVLATIRLGLLGGGLSELDVRRVMSLVVETYSLQALSITAADVLQRFITWRPEDAPGEPKAGTESPDPRPSATEEPDGQPTTGQEPF